MRGSRDFVEHRISGGRYCYVTSIYSNQAQQFTELKRYRYLSNTIYYKSENFIYHLPLSKLRVHLFFTYSKLKFIAKSFVLTYNNSLEMSGALKKNFTCPLTVKSKFVSLSLISSKSINCDLWDSLRPRLTTIAFLHFLVYFLHLVMRKSIR